MHLGGQDFNLAPKFPQMGDFGRQIDENFPTRRFSDIFLTAQNLIGGESVSYTHLTLPTNREV